MRDQSVPGFAPLIAALAGRGITPLVCAGTGVAALGFDTAAGRWLVTEALAAPGRYLAGLHPRAGAAEPLVWLLPRDAGQILELIDSQRPRPGTG